jgi:putative endonuclease
MLGRTAPARPAMSRSGWRVYLLRCADGTLYTGVTNDVERRLRAHQTGRASRYTRSRRPVDLVYLERVRGRGWALQRERAIKKLSRAEKLELIDRQSRSSTE